MRVGIGEYKAFGKYITSPDSIWCEVRLDEKDVPRKLRRLYNLFKTFVPSTHNKPENIFFVIAYHPHRFYWTIYFCHRHFEENEFRDLNALLAFIEKLSWEFGADETYLELLDGIGEKLIVECYARDSRYIPAKIRRAIKEFMLEKSWKSL